VGKVLAVADWLPNMPTAESEAFYQAFRQRYPKPADDYVHMRMQLMIEALAQSIDKAGTADAGPLAAALEKANVKFAGQTGAMRAGDHQLQQSLVVGLMDRQGTPGVKFDVEGSGYGFRVIKALTPAQAQMPHSCRMVPA
jgi:branched-chain amino acid transport system substrate-binding protein